MRLGLVLPRRGPSGLWAMGCEAAAALAVAEINAAGGVLGAQVGLSVACSGETPESAADAADRLCRSDAVDAVIGFQPSHMRGAVRDRLGGRVPYFYTPQYEGGFAGPATVALGLTDAEVLGPALAWLSAVRHVRRAYFVGNDYIWPRTAHGTAQDAMSRNGVTSVGSTVIPFGYQDYGAVLSAIRTARPDLVVTVLLGEEAIRFHRAFALAGMARTTLRLALATDETLLLGIGPDAAENLFAADSFFAGRACRHRDGMLERYSQAFGTGRPGVNVFSLGCYDAVHLAARLARGVGRADAQGLLQAIGHGPRRRCGVRPAGLSGPRRHLPIHIAEADGTGFRVHATV
ncbi:MAG: ABC transporter substrate-binding protein [Pseudomonadota bacterium]